MNFTDHQSKHINEPMSEQLKSFAAPHWQQAVNHKFTQQLGEDNLSDEVFARYLVQDYAFVEVLVNLVAKAIVDAPSMPEKSVLSQFLAAVTSDENTYFLRSFEALGLNTADYLHPKLNPASQAIIDELNDASAHGYEDTIIVLACAEWVYLSWGLLQKDKSPASFYLKEWIELHASTELEEFVTWLRGQLDGFSARDKATRERLASRFARMANLEHNFFTASYNNETA